jgi:hypothetical protein
MDHTGGVEEGVDVAVAVGLAVHLVGVPFHQGHARIVVQQRCHLVRRRNTTISSHIMVVVTLMITRMPMPTPTRTIQWEGRARSRLSHLLLLHDGELVPREAEVVVLLEQRPRAGVRVIGNLGR